MGVLGHGNRLGVLTEAWGAQGAQLLQWRAQGVGAPPSGYPPSWLLLLRFKVSYRHMLENIDPRKIPGQFESV